MKTMVALVGSLPLILASAGSAMAQSADNVQVEAAPQAQVPPGYPQQGYQGQDPGAPPPAPQVAAQSGGEWQYIDGEGWVWVPAGAQTYAVDNTPYVYLYTPSYGWTWYASPWGWGPYYRGAWNHNPYWGRGGWAHYNGGRPVYGGGRYGGDGRYGGRPAYGGGGRYNGGGAPYGGAHYGGGAQYGGAHYGGGAQYGGAHYGAPQTAGHSSGGRHYGGGGHPVGRGGGGRGGGGHGGGHR